MAPAQNGGLVSACDSHYKSRPAHDMRLVEAQTSLHPCLPTCAPGRSVTAAATSSPITRLGTPNTAACCTAGWLCSTASTSVAAGAEGSGVGVSMAG